MTTQATSFTIRMEDCMTRYMAVIREHFHYHPDHALTWVDANLAAKWAAGLHKRASTVILSNDRYKTMTGITLKANGQRISIVYENGDFIMLIHMTLDQKDFELLYYNLTMSLIHKAMAFSITNIAYKGVSERERKEEKEKKESKEKSNV